MISYTLNGIKRTFSGDLEETLLDHLRLEHKITSAKDGCSGQGVCGACTVEIDGKPKLACRTKMKDLEGAEINTTEGLPKEFRSTIGKNFADKGAVQCGFCSPGMIMRAKGLYNVNKTPTRPEIVKAITPNICRCTGYVKIVDAIDETFKELNGKGSENKDKSALIGKPYPKCMSGIAREAQLFPVKMQHLQPVQEIGLSLSRQ